MGGCASPPKEYISDDDIEVAIGGARPSIRRPMPSQIRFSQGQRRSRYSSANIEFGRGGVVTKAHKEILRKCRGLLDKLDQCGTASPEWNSWIMEIVNLLIGIKRRNKGLQASDQARQLMSSLLSKGSTEDKAIGNHYLNLTDNWHSNNWHFYQSRTHSLQRSQPRWLQSEKVVREVSTSYEFPVKNTTSAAQTSDSQIKIPSPQEGKLLKSPQALQYPGPSLFPGLKSLLTWNFDLFAFSDETSGRPLSTIFLHKCSQMKVETTIEGIDMAKLSNYILEVESHYGNNPYHNFIHAADVVHSCINLMETKYIKEALDHDHLFALVFAAAVHDFRHPGVSNDFLVKTNHEIATTYNDTSVLENWHTSQAFLLLSKSKFNFLGNVEATKRALIRRRVIYAVLMTDMKHHGEHVEDLQDFLEYKENSCEIIDPGLLISHCLHVSDISHPTKQFRIHQQWSSRINQEFLLQGDRELKLGMEPGALFDRSKVNMKKSQLGFIDFIILPLWVNWIALIGENEELIDQIHSNKDEWLRLINLEKQQKLSFGNSDVTVQDKAQCEKVQMLMTNKIFSIDITEDDYNESRLMPTPHLAEIDITTPRNAIEPKVSPNLNGQQKYTSSVLLHPHIEAGCRTSYAVLNTAGVSTEIVILPEDPKTDDKDSFLSNSSSKGSASPDLEDKVSGNDHYLKEPRDTQLFDRDSSVINMSLNEDDVDKSSKEHVAHNIFQLQSVRTDSTKHSSNPRWTSRLTLGTVESNSHIS